MSELTIEQILWKAVHDIENGAAKTIQEDPVDGLLPLNKKLSKKNISAQSAKYNHFNNFKPVSRPTIDACEEICEYLNSRDDSLDYLKRIKELESKNKALIEQVKSSEEYSAKILNENYRLNEQVKFLSNKSKK